MIVHGDLARMKESLDDMVGQQIQLTSRRGRKRPIVRKGVIEQTYPSIFIVKLENTQKPTVAGRRISFSYADVLTKAVEVALYKAE